MGKRPEDIEGLTTELQACLRSGEYLDALDICEEIESLGGMQIVHWLAMARCLMELRRKADAKRAWLQAVELDPDQAEAVEGLNRNFPGWRRQAARPVAPPPAAAPERPVRPSAPPRVAEGAPPARTQRAAPSRPEPTEVMPPRPVMRPAVFVPPAGAAAGSSEGTVNWDYVLRDVAEAEAERVRR